MIEWLPILVGHLHHRGRRRHRALGSGFGVGTGAETFVRRASDRRTGQSYAERSPAECGARRRDVCGAVRDECRRRRWSWIARPTKRRPIRRRGRTCSRRSCSRLSPRWRCYARSGRRRVWRVELPDTPDHRRKLADAIDHLVDGVASSEERAEFLDVRYLHPQIEPVRRATVMLVAKYDADLPEHFRAQIKQWTAGIRGSAE